MKTFRSTAPWVVSLSLIRASPEARPSLRALSPPRYPYRSMKSGEHRENPSWSVLLSLVDDSSKGPKNSRNKASNLTRCDNRLINSKFLTPCGEVHGLPLLSERVSQLSSTTQIIKGVWHEGGKYQCSVGDCLPRDQNVEIMTTYHFHRSQATNLGKDVTFREPSLART